MKAKLLIIVSCLSLFFCPISQAQYFGFNFDIGFNVNSCGGYLQDGCGMADNDSCDFGGGCAQSYGYCSCTDPACGHNPCLNAGACCHAFGNIGASDFQPLGCAYGEC